MWHVLHLIARPIEVLLGLFCIVTALLLYPNQEGKIQSKLEDFWIRVDDFQQLALSRHAAFMTGVARLESRLLDRAFGHKLFSMQSVIVSGWFSLASLWVAGTYLTELTHLRVVSVPHSWVQRDVILGLSCMCLVVALLSNRRILRKACLGASGLLLVGMVQWFILEYYVDGKILTTGLDDHGAVLLLNLLGGFFCDIAFIATTRLLIRWAGETNHTWKIIAVLVLDFSVAIILIGPALVWNDMRVFRLLLIAPLIFDLVIPTASMSNIFDTVLALLFVPLALTVLLHRVLWPFLTRTLFRMTDIGTKGRRAILTTVGFALLAAGISGKVPELIQKVIEKLGG